MLRHYQGMRRCMVNTAHLAATGQSFKLVGPRLAHQLAFQNRNALQPLEPLEEFHHTLSTLRLKDDPKKDIVENEVDKGQNEDKEQPDVENNNEKDPSKERDPVDKSKKESSVTRTKLAPESSSGISAAAAPPSGNDDGKPKNQSAADELPEVYPQIIALPISRRPLFPGFYKAVIITNVNVIKAIRESLDKGYPYIGCFLFKDENADSDIITNKDEVHEIGVLAQITSNVFSKDSETGVESLTTVLYPHKRIRIDELFSPKEGEDLNKDVESAKVVPSERPTKRSRKEIIQGITGEKEGDGPKRSIEDEEEDLVSDEAQEVTTEKDENPTEFLKNYPITLVNVSNVNDLPYERDSPVINSLTASILEVLKEMSNMNKMFADHLATFSASLQKDVFQCPEKLADFAAAVTAGNENDLQDILNCLDIEKRLEKSFTILKKELMNKELQRKIEKDIEERMAKRHREYHLNEQLKWIKKELGIDDGRDKLIAKYNDRVKDLNMPADVMKVYEDEIAKLQTLEPLMSEFTVTRNYLDWLTQIPWGKQSKDEYNIKKAITVLDDDHYGLKDVKDRILEFIAVGKLLNKINGKIICFVGPPGVGKTSIGKSIARALNRKFYRFSVGGLSDVSEIKGHRRTYVGAIPGRVVQALKKTETENPLILIDEIDKISHTHSVNGGDPSSALLELLDPEQNNSFLDNYMDVPIDLSKVLFVCTANQLNTIPGPLLDRMEVIEISGYIADEKIKIAERYLAPEAKQSAGLQDVNVDLTEEVIQSLIKNYCRESGVRNLKKQIEKIYRKAALNVVRELGEEETERTEVEPEEETASLANPKIADEPEQSSQSQSSNDESKPDVKTAKEVKESLPQIKVPESFKIEITPDNLKDYVGPPVYTSDRLYETTPPGVVMGLAWTSMGGSSLYIESVLEQPLSHDSTPRLEITGQLGDVMKESSRIAYSFARMFMTKNYPENKFFERAKIHLHCPEGATPKDGPSAGVTMTSSLLSLALDKSLSPTIAMTGELTLTGRVLRIGGLKEKSIAAKRSGVDTIIFPKDNLSDWKELPENIKEGLTPVPVEWYHEVFEKVLPGISVAEASNIWKAEFDKINQKEAEKEKSA